MENKLSNELFSPLLTDNVLIKHSSSEKDY